VKQQLNSTQRIGGSAMMWHTRPKSKRRKARIAKVTLDFRLRKDLLVCETERSYSSIAASMARRYPALQEVKRNDFNTATARPVWRHSTRCYRCCLLLQAVDDLTNSEVFLETSDSVNGCCAIPSSSLLVATGSRRPQHTKWVGKCM